MLQWEFSVLNFTFSISFLRFEGSIFNVFDFVSMLFTILRLSWDLRNGRRFKEEKSWFEIQVNSKIDFSGFCDFFGRRTTGLKPRQFLGGLNQNLVWPSCRASLSEQFLLLRNSQQPPITTENGSQFMSKLRFLNIFFLKPGLTKKFHFYKGLPIFTRWRCLFYAQIRNSTKIGLSATVSKNAYMELVQNVSADSEWYFNGPWLALNSGKLTSKITIY